MVHCLLLIGSLLVGQTEDRPAVAPLNTEALMGLGVDKKRITAEMWGE